MRVAMYYNNKDVRLEEMPWPEIGPGEILVKVIASGVCGSDVMEWYRIKKAPIVLGHEVTGDIAEVGKGVDGFQVGDRVVFTHHVPCHDCRYCQAGQHTLCDTLHSTKFYPGGFSEYVRVPKINVDRGGVIKLPDSMSYETGTFTEPLGCAVRGQRKAALKPGDSVLILGSGLSGLLNLKLVQALGAGRIVTTDVNTYRLQAALNAGAEASFNALEEGLVARLLEANEGRGYDQVIVCTAAPAAFQQAMQAVDRGGTTLLYAINTPGTELPFAIYDFYHKGVNLISTYGASPLDLQEALKLLQYGRIEVESFITHRLPLAETVKGFELTARAQDSMKVIIEPQV
ncbi:MAG TPA: alcohol dehydrogenase [Anaerolineae bacterium]|nr:alcohol dehydrogenase [Anaerolineae bacterium]